METNGGIIEPDKLSTSHWNNVTEIIFKSQFLIFLWFVLDCCIMLFQAEDFETMRMQD